MSAAGILVIWMCERGQQVSTIATILLSLLLFVGCSKRPGGSADNAPLVQNVVLITVDTLRADHLGCYGYLAIQTPQLDSLASRGTRFAQAVTPVPLTLPSHASILTGTYPFVHGVRDMGGFVLGESPSTMATLLSQAGFRTAAFVGSVTLDHRYGVNRGFDTYDDEMPPAEGQATSRKPERRAEAVVDRTLAWLAARRAGRFFLWVHFFDPHSPYDPPPPFRAQYSGRPYDGEIAYTDAQLGRLLEGIRKQNSSDHTLFVVMADHGESLGEHGESTHGIFLYDAAMRIPLVIAGPGVPAGQVIQAQVRSIDVMPTILAAVKIKAGDYLQGVSLWPLIEGSRGLPPESRFALMETIYPRTHLGWSELRAVRTKEWKYIQAPQEELYSLLTDPSESRNTVKSDVAVTQRFKTVLSGALGEASRDMMLHPSTIPAEVRQELASLGYVSAGVGQPIKLDQSRPDPKTRVNLLPSFEAAITFTSQQQYRRALPLLQTIVKADPTNPLFYLRLAFCYQSLNDTRAEMATYERAAHHHAETDEMLNRLGNLLLEGGKYRRAITAFERALQLNPENSESVKNLAICLFELGQLQESEKAFRSLLGHSAMQASAHYGIGLIRLKQNQRSEAASELQQAVQLDPKLWDAWFNLGVCYQEIGKNQEAVQCLEEFNRGAPPEQFPESIKQARQLITLLKRTKG
jgi:choline-sulfatase